MIESSKIIIINDNDIHQSICSTNSYHKLYILFIFTSLRGLALPAILSSILLKHQLIQCLCVFGTRNPSMYINASPQAWSCMKWRRWGHYCGLAYLAIMQCISLSLECLNQSNEKCFWELLLLWIFCLWFAHDELSCTLLIFVTTILAVNYRGTVNYPVLPWLLWVTSSNKTIFLDSNKCELW